MKKILASVSIIALTALPISAQEAGSSAGSSGGASGGASSGASPSITSPSTSRTMGRSSRGEVDPDERRGSW